MSAVIRCKFSSVPTESPQLIPPGGKETRDGGQSSPSPLGNTKLLQHIGKPLKKFSLSSAFPYGSPSISRRQQKETGSPSLAKSRTGGGGNRLIQPTSPCDSGGAQNGHSKQSKQDNDRKLSSPLDYRDSGVYLGDSRRDPVLEMLNLRKQQKAKSLTVNSSEGSAEEPMSPLSPTATVESDSGPNSSRSLYAPADSSMRQPCANGRRRYSKSVGESSSPNFDCELSLDTESQETLDEDEEDAEEDQPPARPVSATAPLGRHSEEFIFESDPFTKTSKARGSGRKTSKNSDTFSPWTEGLTAKAASLFISTPSPFLFRKHRGSEMKKNGSPRKIALTAVDSGHRQARSAGRQASLFFRRSRSLTGRDSRIVRKKQHIQQVKEWQEGQRDRRRTSSTGDERDDCRQNNDQARRKISQPAMVRFHIDGESPNCEDRKGNTVKKKRSFAEPIAKKLSFLRRRPTDSSLVSPSSNEPCVSPTSTISPGSPNQRVPTKPPSKEDVRKWATSFEDLLGHQYGAMLFRLFLQREFSEENIDFWLACEEYKRLRDHDQLPATAKEIYSAYVAVQAPKEVNLDSVTRDITAAGCNSPTKSTFEQAQHRIQSLMEKDSYPRFLRSDLYLDLVKKC